MEVTCTQETTLSASALLESCPDPSMKRVDELVTKGAKSRSVLLRGETGVGKEIVAKSLHERGPRGDRPFVTLDCTNLNPSLMGSELFGHEKGAFTGADRCRDGFCAEAHGGTLFLDEVGELPLDYQVRLLRVLDGQSFTRVGSTEPRISDLHVVAATNRDLGEMVRKGKFRQDLFFRLNVFPISVPALRERPKDIPYLAEHFVARLSPAVSIDPNSKSVLQAHSWPGNVRELRNTIERSALLSGDGVIRPLYVKQSLEMYTQDQSQGEDDVVGTLEEVLARLTDLTNGKSLAETLDIVELGIIKFTAALYGGNMSKTARVLSTELKRVRSRLREAGLTKDDLR